MNLDSFTVDAVMVHDVPRGNDEGDELVLTDLPIDVDPDLRRYFRSKIITSLRERGVEVAADENEDDTVRAAVARVSRIATSWSASPDSSLSGWTRFRRGGTRLGCWQSSPGQSTIGRVRPS